MRLASGLYEMAQEIAPGVRIEYHNDITTVKNWGEYEPKRNTIRLSKATMMGTPEVQKYVLLHELTHATTTMRHNNEFYGALTELISRYNVSWLLAAKIEQIIPEVWYNNMTDTEKELWKAYNFEEYN